MGIKSSETNVGLELINKNVPYLDISKIKPEWKIAEYFIFLAYQHVWTTDLNSSVSLHYV